MGSPDSGAEVISLHTVESWPYLPVLIRLTLAVFLGLFIGLERERRGSEAGMLVFAFAAMLGCLCGMLSDTYAVTGLALLGLAVIFLNWQRIRTRQPVETASSIALFVTGIMGILCGKGQTFVPICAAVFTGALLAWKERVTYISRVLTDAEIRSAILLAILAFVIYPVLPANSLDPWGLIEPRSAWVTVLLIATIGFVNYILLKIYGARGAAMAGFLGGLVNSTVVVTELAQRARGDAHEPAAHEAKDTPDAEPSATAGANDALLFGAYRGVLLATAAMLLRNGVLLVLLSPGSLLESALLPLLLMLATAIALSFRGPRRFGSQPGAAGDPDTASKSQPLHLKSPFSLQSTLKFGIIFLVMHATGTLAQRFLGVLGFYGISVAGGFISSASAVASAGNMASQGDIGPVVAGIGSLLASVASAAVNLPLIARISRQPRLSQQIARSLALIVMAGIAGGILQYAVLHMLQQNGRIPVAFSRGPAQK